MNIRKALLRALAPVTAIALLCPLTACTDDEPGDDNTQTDTPSDSDEDEGTNQAVAFWAARPHEITGNDFGFALLRPQSDDRESIEDENLTPRHVLVRGERSYGPHADMTIDRDAGTITFNEYDIIGMVSDDEPVTARITLNSAGHLTHMEAEKDMYTERMLTSYDYSYDSDGHLTSIRRQQQYQLNRNGKGWVNDRTETFTATLRWLNGNVAHAEATHRATDLPDADTPYVNRDLSISAALSYGQAPQFSNPNTPLYYNPGVLSVLQADIFTKAMALCGLLGEAPADLPHEATAKTIENRPTYSEAKVTDSTLRWNYVIIPITTTRGIYDYVKAISDGTTYTEYRY